MTVLKLEGLTKTFEGKKGNVNALSDINIEIEEGEIFGIIGMSGAGKSTLVRCINLLEKPTSGSVVFDEDFHDISAVQPADAADSA